RADDHAALPVLRAPLPATPGGSRSPRRPGGHRPPPGALAPAELVQLLLGLGRRSRLGISAALERFGREAHRRRRARDGGIAVADAVDHLTDDRVVGVRYPSDWLDLA